METFKRIGFEKTEFEVTFTDEFMEDKDERIEHFNEYFYSCDDLDDYIKNVIAAVMHHDYGSSHNDRMIEGFGPIWMKNDFNEKLYKPTPDGWRVAEEGELPKCGIIVTKKDSRKHFVTDEEKLEKEYYNELPVDDFE